jgi:hypothetical protein
MIPLAVYLLLIAGPDGSTQQTLPVTFQVLVAPLPAPATPGTFPPLGEDVLQAWSARNLDQAGRVEWHDITSIPWGRVEQQVKRRNPAAVIGDYQFLSATIAKEYAPYLTWSSPQPRQIASLLTLKDSGIRRITDLRGKIVGVIHPAYPLGGGAQQKLLESAGLQPEETHVDALGTAQEVVHHLFAGTIDAAGLPEGEAENALLQFGHADAASDLRVISEFKFPTSRYALFVRRDLLSPIAAFPAMLAETLSSLYPPGYTQRETVREASRVPSAPGIPDATKTQ